MKTATPNQIILYKKFCNLVGQALDENIKLDWTQLMQAFLDEQHGRHYFKGEGTNG